MQESEAIPRAEILPGLPRADRGSERRDVLQRKGAEYRETRNARNKERYRERKENGICVKCGKKPAKYGLYCYECSIKVKREQAKKNERRRQDNSPFALRDWKKEHRVCYWCGNPIELGNMTSYCDACRRKLSKQAAKNLADKPLKPWKFGGALHGTDN